LLSIFANCNPNDDLVLKNEDDEIDDLFNNSYLSKDSLSLRSPPVSKNPTTKSKKNERILDSYLPPSINSKFNISGANHPDAKPNLSYNKRMALDNAKTPIIDNEFLSFIRKTSVRISPKNQYEDAGERYPSTTVNQISIFKTSDIPIKEPEIIEHKKRNSGWEDLGEPLSPQKRAMSYMPLKQPLPSPLKNLDRLNLMLDEIQGILTIDTPPPESSKRDFFNKFMASATHVSPIHGKRNSTAGQFITHKTVTSETNRLDELANDIMEEDKDLEDEILKECFDLEDEL